MKKHLQNLHSVGEKITREPEHLGGDVRMRGGEKILYSLLFSSASVKLVSCTLERLDFLTDLQVLLQLA